MNYIAMPGLKYREVDDTYTRRAKVIESVCQAFDISFKRLHTTKRHKPLAISRNLIFFFLRKHTSMTWLEIGSVFKRDHTTAIHGYTAIKNYFETDEVFRKQVMEIENKILS